jgi:endonuclease/exonuclease/phosphatase (EEP) superfamily protein YafD
MTYRTLVVLSVVVLASLELCGCSGKPVVNPDPNDQSAPTLTLSSLGLRKEISIGTGTGTPSPLRLRASDSIQLLAQAMDSESGITRVSIRGNLNVVCIPPNSTHKITIVDPVAVDNVHPGASGMPTSLTAALGMDGASQRAKCHGSGSTFSELTGSLTASATNGAGKNVELAALRVRSFGLDVVHVATFNLYRPGNHADSVYQAWGQFLNGRADVLLLTEVEDRRRAELIASAAGLPNVVLLRDSDSDIAIASRGPIHDVYRHIVDPPGSSLGSAESNIMVVDTDLGGWPHRVAVAHFGIRDANDELFEAWRSAPSRFEAAKQIIAEIDSRSPDEPIIVGGDFNAYSGVGPQDRPGATAEVTLLRNRLTDPVVSLQVSDADLCGGRIDYILIEGYVPTGYQHDCVHNIGSDHPMVLATIEAN